MNRTNVASIVLATTLVLAGCGGEGDRPAAERVPVPPSAQDPAPVELARADFDVDGMDCGGCVIGTRMALQKLDGVAQADASYDEATGAGAAWARYDPAKVTAERMMMAIRELGYAPRLAEAEAEAES